MGQDDGDVFEGIAKVLGNIERLKGSEASDGETTNDGGRRTDNDVTAFSAGTYQARRRY
jgi:hypothetical protein